MRPEIDYVYNKLKKLRFDFDSMDFNASRNKYRYDFDLGRYVRKDDNDLFIAKDTFKPLEEELEYADSCHNLEEQIGCPLEAVVKVLEIIKEYQVDVWLLKQCDYENYIRIRKESMVSVGQIVNENGIILEDEITEEYFDLVKRFVG